MASMVVAMVVSSRVKVRLYEPQRTVPSLAAPGFQSPFSGEPALARAAHTLRRHRVSRG